MYPFSNCSLMCYVWTSLIRRQVGLHRFFFLFLSRKPMYDTISCFAHVRYDLTFRSCTIRSWRRHWYDINLGATATTILRMRGVQIPIDLVSSATDSFRRSVVLFKPMSIPTSDPKSEFLCQSSYIAQNIQASPWTTSYAWEISHTLVTTYHPYCHSPSALTEYLKQKLCLQRAKRLGRSLPTQVESNIQLEHNMMNFLSTSSSSIVMGVTVTTTVRLT